MKGAWVNKILFAGFTLPLLVIYLFLHLQVRPGLLHITELDLDESTLVISAPRPSQQGKIHSNHFGTGNSLDN